MQVLLCRQSLGHIADASRGTMVATVVRFHAYMSKEPLIPSMLSPRDNLHRWMYLEKPIQTI